MNLLINTLLIGVGATLVMDCWSVLRKVLLGVEPPNWGLVGRWVFYLGKGRFFHDSIKRTEPVVGETMIGWCTHYIVGVLFALLLLLIYGNTWLSNPTLLPALMVGLCTVLAPFMLMQPGMGAGVASSRSPKPWAARSNSIVAHMVFGLGLYIAALGLQALQG